MLVVHASLHCCIRVVKESLALMEAGVHCHHLQSRLANQESQLYLRSMEFYRQPEHYVEKLRMLGPDIIHVHNEPDWLVYSAKLACPGVPVVYDCHDLDSQRMGEPSDDEVKAFAAADAYIFPSRSYLKGAETVHGKAMADKPRAVVYSQCIRDFVVKRPLPRQRGVVYQGGAVVTDSGNYELYAYRDYRQVATALTAAGVPFTMYGVSERFRFAYLATGAVVFPSTEYGVMLQQLSRYDWGLVGCPVRHPQWDKAMPNKLFEYMAAGIPILVHHAAECAEFVRQHKVGIVVEHLSDPVWLADMLNDAKLREDCREAVMDLRGQFVMENQVPTILGLYDAVVGRCGRVAA